MASIKVSLLADPRSLVRGFKTSTKAAEKFDRSMSKSGKTADKQKSAFAGLGRTVVGLGAGYLGASGLISVVRASFEEMAQSAKVTAQTNAVLKSTGGVAGVTAEHVDRLGSSLLRKSGVDDEVIRSGENMLLTFRDIRNSAGKGNDIFDRTTKATLDLDAAMTHGNVTQESLSKTAIRVGKALNDPIKGVTSLRRVGVQFTDDQNKQIKAMVKSGNVMGAQKLILGELNAEFGGSAAAIGGTLPGKINILRESFRNLGGSLATSLVPAFTKLIDSANKWITNTENVKRVQDTFKQIVSGVTSVLRGLRSVLNGVNSITGSTKNTVKLLIGAFVVFKALSMAAAVSRIAGSFKLLRTEAVAATGATEAASAAGALSAGGKGATAKTAFGKLKSFAAIAATVAATTSKVTLLKTALKTLALRAAIPITIVIATKFITDKLGGNSDFSPKRFIDEGFGGANPFAAKNRGPLLKKLFGDGQKKAFEGGGSLGGLDEFLARAKPKKPKPLFGKASNVDTRAADAALAKDAADLKKKSKVNFENRNKVFDALIGRRLDRVQDIKSSAGQIVALTKIGAQIQKRLAITKDVSRKITLEDQLLGIVRQKRELRKTIRDNAETALTDSLQLNLSRAEATKGFGDDLAALAKIRAHILARIKAEGKTTALEQELFDNQQATIGKRKDAADKRKEKLAAKQFFALGLDPTGGERVPFKKTLQRQLGTVSAAVKGTFLDTPKTQKLLARLRKVLKEGIVPTDVRAKVKEMLAGINDELKNGAQGHTKFKKANTDAMLEGLGLSGKQIQALRSRLSQVGANGTVNRRRGLAPGGAGAAVDTKPIVVHTHVNLDGWQVAVNTTKHQAARRATSRRG